MKPIFYFCFLVIVLSVMSCGSSCKTTKTSDGFIVENSEVKIIKKVTYQLFNDASTSSYVMSMVVAKSNKVIELEHIYFRHSKGAIKTTSEGFKANLKIEKTKDIQLSSNPSDEYNNELPTNNDFPFLLNDDECIISYFENDRHKFIRVTKLKEIN